MNKIINKNYDPINSILHLNQKISEKYGDKVAYRYFDSKKNVLEMTYAELSANNIALAAALTQMRLKGKRIAIVGESCPEWVMTYIATLSIGSIAIPLDKELAVSELFSFLDISEADAIVFTKSFCDKFKDRIIASSNDMVFIPIACDDEDLLKCENVILFSDVLKSGKEKAESEGFALSEYELTDDMREMLFTSGTTGYPRIATHSYKYALGHYPTAKHWHNVNPDGLHFTISDTGWGKALWGKLYGQWLCEAAQFTYDFDRFHSEDILPMFAKYHITTFCAPPTMYRFFIKEDLSKYDLSSIEYATTAGEALNPEVFNQFKKATGLTIMEGFGQTETTLSIANFVGSTPKIGSMGRPSPLYDVVVLDPDGNVCKTGDTGEICIRVKDSVPCGLFIGYYLDEEKTNEVWHDGYYHTGDQATMDEDGYLWYVGRIDDVIKSSGYRIGPFEIESVIMELPYVLECAITPVPDEVRGQIVKATIVLVKGTEGTDELKKEIQEYVKTHTAPYKYPRIVEFVEELPKTISGKVRRVEIRKNDLEKMNK